MTNESKTFDAETMEAAYNAGFMAGYAHAKHVIAGALGMAPETKFEAQRRVDDLEARRDADRPNFDGSDDWPAAIGLV